MLFLKWIFIYKSQNIIILKINVLIYFTQPGVAPLKKLDI